MHAVELGFSLSPYRSPTLCCLVSACMFVCVCVCFTPMTWSVGVWVPVVFLSSVRFMPWEPWKLYGMLPATCRIKGVTQSIRWLTGMPKVRKIRVTRETRTERILRQQLEETPSSAPIRSCFGWCSSARPSWVITSLSVFCSHVVRVYTTSTSCTCPLYLLTYMRHCFCSMHYNILLTTL